MVAKRLGRRPGVKKIPVTIQLKCDGKYLRRLTKMAFDAGVTRGELIEIWIDLHEAHQKTEAGREQ